MSSRPRGGSPSSRRFKASLWLVILFGLSTSTVAAQEPDTFQRFSFTNPAGAMQYMVYTPPGPLRAGRPLVVFLHGAGFDAPRSAADTLFNELAKREGFVVVYPEVANMGCWGWASAEHQQRDAGQPSQVAGITRKVMQDWSIDPNQVWVNGVSCGGAMANVMAATYPDVYAAVAAHASCPYKGSPCFGSRSLASDDEAAKAINDAMGPRARAMPFLAAVGSADPLAPPEVTEQVVRSWLGAADLADDGANNKSIERTPSAISRQQIPGGRSFEVAVYSDRFGCLIGERWLIEGMSHAYSGGQNSDRPSQVQKSPDVTLAAFLFFKSHQMGSRGPGCIASPPSTVGAVNIPRSTLDDESFLPESGVLTGPSVETALPDGSTTLDETGASEVAELVSSGYLYPVIWLLPLALLVLGGYLAYALTNPVLVRARSQRS